MQDIRIGAVQMNGLLFAVEENLDQVESWSAQAADQGAELLLFPETLIHGHCSDSKCWHIAEPVPAGSTIRRLEKIARQHNLFLSVGMTEKERDIVYNCQALVGPRGYVGKSRKVHPSGDEVMLFTAGWEMPVFDLGKCVVGHSICYDTHFPEVARTLALRGADIILNPNAGRTGPWSTDQEAIQRVKDIKTWFARYAMRAEENAVFWVITNQVGVAGYIDRYPKDHVLQPVHAGGIFFFGPDGSTMAESISDSVEPELVVCELKAQALAEARSTPNYAMRNRKPHLYGDVLKHASELDR